MWNRKFSGQHTLSDIFIKEKKIFFVNALLFVDLGTHTSNKQPLRNSPKMILFYMLRWLSSHQMTAFQQGFCFILKKDRISF